ncbi:MAG: hypothetical protein HYY37_04170 [Candidatus Aenigmarchaeota archaeon]|nr:hypothetical protein [Candidatus Aenigmarchaeota archaeon]
MRYAAKLLPFLLLGSAVLGCEPPVTPTTLRHSQYAGTVTCDYAYPTEEGRKQAVERARTVRPYKKVFIAAYPDGRTFGFVVHTDTPQDGILDVLAEEREMRTRLQGLICPRRTEEKTS